MSDFLSYSEAGEVAGVSKQAIGNAIRDRKLFKNADNKLSREAVVKWASERRTYRGKKRQVDEAVVKVDAIPIAEISVDGPASENARAALMMLDADGVFADRATAERWRDSFVARLRQIEYEEKSKVLLPTSMVMETIASACVRVKTRMLSIPAEQAPALHRCKTVLELQDLLLRCVSEALGELAIEFS